MSTLKVDGIRSNSASSDAITLASDGTCTANISTADITSINGGSIGTNNLVTNGDMKVAQRGSDSTATGLKTVDTWALNHSVQDNPYQMQVAVASGTTPYNLGFRKAFQVMNGNQSNGATASSILYIRQKIESQNIAQSGWNYTDPNSKITLSFWIKSSVAQSFHGHLRSRDGTAQRYPFQTGALTANTWTKITKTIPGNSNLQFDTDTTANSVDRGLDVVICAYMGTTYSDSSATFDQWQGEAAANFAGQDMTTTWFTTNDATLDITGVQLEVGSTASAFAHESYADTLRKCQRYLYVICDQAGGGTSKPIANMQAYATNYLYGNVDLPVEMRTPPTIISASGTSYFILYSNSGVVYAPQVYTARQSSSIVELQVVTATSTVDVDAPYFMRTNNASAYVYVSAEL